MKWILSLDRTTHIAIHGAVLMLWFVGLLRSTWKVGHDDVAELWFALFALLAIVMEIRAIRALQAKTLEFHVWLYEKGKQDLAEHIRSCAGCRQDIADAGRRAEIPHSLN